MSAPRSDQVLALVRAGGRVRLDELAARLQVSEMTIRRDLDALATQGLVRRVRGAAVALPDDAEVATATALSAPRPLDPPAPPPHRAPERPPAMTGSSTSTAPGTSTDERLAAAVLPLLAPGTSVLLDAGPTSLAVARGLHAHRDLTVAVLDLATAAEAALHPGVRLLVLGGEARPGEQALVGPLALAALDRLSFDTAVLTAAGLEARTGWWTTSAERASLHQGVLAAAERVVLTAGPTALGHRALARAGDVTSASVLVTAQPGTPAQLDAVRSARSEGVEVVLV